AWLLVQTRHEVLRTAFRRLPGMELPLQVVLPEPASALTPAELNEQGGDADAALRRQWAEPFDFEAGRVAHAHLLRLGADKHLLALTVSALAADALSLRHLVADLASAYAALSEGTQEQWSAREVLQYADYAEWQQELAESEAGEAGRQFWRGRAQVDGAAEWRLPHEREPAEGTDYPAEDSDARSTWGDAEVETDAKTARRWRDAAAACGVGLREWLLCGWHALAWRAGGGPPVPASCLFDGRQYEDTFDAVGPFSNFIPLNTRIEETASFASNVKIISQTLSDIQEWQEYFTQEENSLSPDLSDISITFQYTDDFTEHQTGPLHFLPRQPRSHSSRSPLLLSAFANPDSLRLRLRFDSTRFAPQGASRLLDALLALLEQAARSPHTPARLLPAVGREERDRLVRSRNLASAPFDPEVCAHTLFERQAALTPDAPAVACGDDSLTYSELNARANRLARRLRALGVGPEVRVALCLERSPEAVVALLAVLKAGGAYVPLDPHYPRERLSFMLGDCGARVLLTQSRLASSLPAHSAPVFLLDSGDDELSSYPAEDPGVRVDASNLAYLIYT
ncbi:MAG TPA: condensation domain-containing protein, partial [Pyrinomonadaceae bacterium]|nr:condensation domain-containing protein [Pyrinomonadaceae bacterium]